MKRISKPTHQNLWCVGKYLEDKRAFIDNGLDSYLPRASDYPSRIHRAMRYSVFSGGKRLRPILTIAASETQGIDGRRALPAACALELIHTFSLIHDDLPALDDDDFRRGKSTCHRKFGEDMAILAGDGLLILAFELLGKSEDLGKDFLKPGVLIREITTAIGTGGMVGGQVVDLMNQDGKASVKALKYIYEKKTAALITAALRIGGIIGGAPSKELSALTDFGMNMGVCFQMVDDLLDKKKDKGPSYPSILGRKKTILKIKELTLNAEKSIECLGKRGSVLRGINQLMVSRTE